MLHNAFRLVPILFLVSFLAACATRPTILPSTEATEALWERFKTADAPKAPYRLQLSLRIGKSGDTRRVTAILWGNDPEAERLDVMAGVGSIVAKIASSPGHFLLVAPIEGKAYAHDGPTSPRLNLSLPLPLTLADLTGILLGRFTDVFGSEYASLVEGPGHTVRYTLSGPLPGALELNNESRPTLWDERENASGNGWSMRIGYGDDGLPKKLDLTNTRGERFLLVVKEKESPAPFSSEALSLSIPVGMPLLPVPERASR